MPRSRIARLCVRAGLHFLASLARLAACTACHAHGASTAAALPDTQQQAPAEALRPNAFFAQYGISNSVTAATAGLIWNPRWGALPAAWSAYIEASLSRWASRGGYPSDQGVLTQVALVPVFRWRASQGRSAWFWQGGIGATLTSSVYHNASKSFSTSFNFADHVDVGYSFGKTRENEVALRYEHFSNASIKHPNPGQDFLQTRYVRHFD